MKVSGSVRFRSAPGRVYEHIARSVIAHAIDTLARQRREIPGLRYSINLSGQTLSDPGVCDLIQAKLAATGLDPAALTFEVTETVAISDMTVASAFLARLKSLGCCTALDDFGSGMSSFAYLQDLPVDCIKIDGRFVKNLAASPVDQAMVRAMNEIAKKKQETSGGAPEPGAVPGPATCELSAVP